MEMTSGSEGNDKWNWWKWQVETKEEVKEMTSAVTGYQIHTLLIIQQPAKYAFLSFEL